MLKNFIYSQLKEKKLDYISVSIYVLNSDMVT